MGYTISFDLPTQGIGVACSVGHTLGLTYDPCLLTRPGGLGSGFSPSQYCNLPSGEPRDFSNPKKAGRISLGKLVV